MLHKILVIVTLYTTAHADNCTGADGIKYIADGLCYKVGPDPFSFGNDDKFWVYLHRDGNGASPEDGWKWTLPNGTTVAPESGVWQPSQPSHTDQNSATVGDQGPVCHGSNPSASIPFLSTILRLQSNPSTAPRTRTVSLSGTTASRPTRTTAWVSKPPSTFVPRKAGFWLLYRSRDKLAPSGMSFHMLWTLGVQRYYYPLCQFGIKELRVEETKLKGQLGYGCKAKTQPMSEVNVENMSECIAECLKLTGCQGVDMDNGACRTFAGTLEAWVVEAHPSSTCLMP